MDIDTTKRFNKQIQRMYTLAVWNIICAVFGLTFYYFEFDIYYALFLTLLFSNAVAVVFYQPWKIQGYMQKGREFKMFYDSFNKERST